MLSDAGDYSKAAATYARALSVSSGASEVASDRLAEAQLEATNWQEHLASLLRRANESDDASKRAALFTRAARIARRYAPDEAEALLARAYAADPESKPVAALYEGMMAEQGRFDALEAKQREILATVPQPKARATLAMTFGTRWVSRHQNLDVGTRLLEEALKLDAANEGAFFYLRETYGKKGGDWDRVLTLAEDAATHAGENGNATFLLAQAGTIAWRQMGNLMRARGAFERLRAVAPEHPQLRAFELQIGETLSPSAIAELNAAHDVVGAATAPPASDVPTARQNEQPTRPPPSEAVEPPAVAAAPPPPDVEVAPREPAAPPPPAPVPPAPADEPAPAEAAPVADLAKIAELRAAAEKQETGKRFNEYVKTILALAGLVPEHDEKISLLMKAADLYVSKFANQAEAVKVYEQVAAIDPDNPTATEYLRQMYERRRDWEKLLVLQRRDADRIPSGPQRAAKFVEIAKLATERVKKPDICIELWNEVLISDDANADALAALAGLYERSRDYEKLASVLEKQAEVTFDAPAKIQILNKLGTIYGDRLNNDEGAVAAWRSLLVLDPNDRRAQDALKKKYLALGRWDDLEVFYAESGKWDEFIRVLEQQEAKESQPTAKISLLFKIAQLWADKKQKNDRAAKAYEKVLELEPQNLQAAEALIPIYTAANNAKALANAIEVKLGHEEDPGVKLGLYRDVAALYEGKVKEPQKAFDRYLAAFELFPTDERSSADVERAAKATTGWPSVIAAYEKAIEGMDMNGERDAAIMLRLRLGRILVEEVQRIDDAIACFRAVYDADGENGEALAALERLYRQTARFADLLGIYEKKRDLALDAQEKKAINYEIAKLFETEIQDLDKAIETYCSVLEDDGADARALAALDVLYGRLSRWEPYVDTLRRRIELDVSEAELIDLKFRLGQTLEQHLGDPAGALENYREILFLDAQHEGARLALEKLMQESELRAEAAAILESIYEERADWKKLIGALEILSTAEQDVGKRVQLRRKSARISAEQVKDHAHAFESLARALKDDPTLAETRQEIEAIAEAASAWRPLVTLYGEIAEGLTDAQLAREYWMRLARIDERLDDVDAAAQAYIHVLSRSVGRRGARRSRAALHAHPALVGSHRRRGTSHRADTRRRGARGALRAHRPDLRREARPARRRRHRLSQGAGARAGERERAHGARRALHPSEDVGRARGEPRGAARPRHDRRGPDRLHASPRRPPRIGDGTGGRGHRGLPGRSRTRANE